MRLYIFKSETRRDLQAFAGEPGGDKLPKHHGPWTGTGIVTDERAPPFNLSRETVENAIAKDGFQLWRRVSKPDEKLIGIEDACKV
jgi:hypothetical protein